MLAVPCQTGLALVSYAMNARNAHRRGGAESEESNARPWRHYLSCETMLPSTDRSAHNSPQHT
eukprot:3475841-Pyramimonas_sp.AAC.2